MYLCEELHMLVGLYSHGTTRWRFTIATAAIATTMGIIVYS